ncbi:MAG: hypothetical protein HY364_02700 [Candidatus Aenigmarchaeota archaeon]|nr:hypothetical protein [Candidatus Aenigmarchaeota archaeon]
MEYLGDLAHRAVELNNGGRKRLAQEYDYDLISYSPYPLAGNRYPLVFFRRKTDKGDLSSVYPQSVDAGLSFLRIPEMAGRSTQYVLCQYGLGNELGPIAVISEKNGTRLFGINPSTTKYDMTAIISIAENWTCSPTNIFFQASPRTSKGY